MIGLFQVVQHIAAVKNDLALKEVLVIKDMLMLDENDHHVNVLEELVEVGVLVLGDPAGQPHQILAPLSSSSR